MQCSKISTARSAGSYVPRVGAKDKPIPPLIRDFYVIRMWFQPSRNLFQVETIFFLKDVHSTQSSVSQLRDKLVVEKWTSARWINVNVFYRTALSISRAIFSISLSNTKTRHRNNVKLLYCLTDCGLP